MSTSVQGKNNNLLVCQRYDYKRKKCRYSIAYIMPVDFKNTNAKNKGKFVKLISQNYQRITRAHALPYHQSTCNSQGTTSCPRRDRCKDRREENGNKKHEANDHASYSGLATLCSDQLYEVTQITIRLTTDSSSALNECSDGARSYEGPHTDGESIDTISNGRMLEI